MENVLILTESKAKEFFRTELRKVLSQEIPQIIRRANRKEILTTAELKELTGMSSRMQKYHRDEGNLPFSQDGRKIFYKTEEVEKFMAERRIEGQEE